MCLITPNCELLLEEFQSHLVPGHVDSFRLCFLSSNRAAAGQNENLHRSDKLSGRLDVLLVSFFYLCNFLSMSKVSFSRERAKIRKGGFVGKALLMF